MESKRTCLGKLEVIFVVAQLALFVSAQDCFLATHKVATPLSNATYLLNGTQAIITSYKFGCCGNITTWQTYVEPGGSRIPGLYDIAFQVWRPSPTVQENGCYSMVGENSYTSVSIGSGGLVSETPEQTNILTVQPGDVVGYFTINNRRILRAGIQLDNKQSKHSVWYQRYRDRRPFIVRAPDCPFPIGTETGRSLMFSINAAPVLTVSMASFSCPVIYTISPSSSSPSPSMIATTTSVPTRIRDITPQLFQTITHLISEPTVVLSMSVNLARPSSIVSSILSVSISPISSPAPDTSSAALSTAVVAIIAVVGSSAPLLTLLCMLLLAITLTKVRQMRQINFSETVIDQQQQVQVNTPMNITENETYIPTSHSIGEWPLTESQL